MEEEGVDSQFSCTSSEHQLPVLMPSRVGREFVRQYYRLLKKAPEFLHRFYTNDSTCTHGDFDMALGKRDIQSLFRRENYTDCNTKILHIDIHGTLVNGVVVLVTGEQSNAGFPMRPFVQTFVLAAQGPRRYYVCNDIFRFTDASVKPRPVVDVDCQTSILHIGDGDQHYHYMQQQLQQQQGFQDFEEETCEGDLFSGIPTEKMHSPSMDSGTARMHIVESCTIPMPRWANTRQNKDVKLNNFQQHNQIDQQNQMDQLTYSCEHMGDDNNMASSDGYVKDGQGQQECPFYRSLIAQALTPGMEFEEVTPMSSSGYEESTYYNEEVSRVSIGVSSGRGLQRHSDSMIGVQSQHNLNEHDSNECTSYSYQQIEETQTQSNENQEKMPTYAKLLMSAFTRASLKNNQSHKMSMNTSSIASPLRATGIPTYNSNDKSNEDITSASNQSSPAPEITEHQDHSFAATPAQSFFPIQRNNYTQGMRRNDRRRASSAQKYDDNQQLFLGQIPHNATEDELINIFSCFGNVLELRILPNLGGKIQPGAKHPLKYGFLTFEHVESVKACLESRPVFFPNNSPDGQKLNVRAKKPSVSRDEVPPACQSLDSQSMGNDWLKTSTRRNNSVSHNIVGVSGGNGSNIIFNRKDNRHNRGASLDSGTQIQSGKKFVQPAGAGGPGSCGRR